MLCFGGHYDEKSVNRVKSRNLRMDGIHVAIAALSSKPSRRGYMKFTFATAVLLGLLSTAFADSGSIGAGRLRLAQGSSEACTSNCATQAASCKRTCPATFNTPCLNACDTQAQTCIRSCQAK